MNGGGMDDRKVGAGSTLGFIGLGTLGAPIARNLIADGYRVVGFDRSSEALADFSRGGGRGATSGPEVGRGSAVVFTCVRTKDDLTAVLTGPDGLLAELPPGS